eukprot:CAMPEP_0175663756 /NCGR_PEP_ID=MMETSP0097-20121207/16171_1 /TAXON_ID=311494 /ORGANISM="Alexandrium monilatum, Strain CCMP3105" /LENGTH=600 /DNA_ID=CAMNT_0016970035 /DNA_START=20 /DNA_END=1822 /DNA_ORIENTATION=+
MVVMQPSRPVVLSQVPLPVTKQTEAQHPGGQSTRPGTVVDPFPEAEPSRSGSPATGPPAVAIIGTVPPRVLLEGKAASIGRHQFVVGSALGEGAYAKVYAARCMGTSEEVAIKEMRCGQGPGILPDATVQRARFEVQVMRRLADSDEDFCAPRLLDHQFWQFGDSAPNAFLCRVAMTLRRGQPVVTWLEERRLKYEGLVAAAPGCLGHKELDLYCTSFLDAARTAREMLVQLGPTLEKLNSGIAIHRDVNARNILVHSPVDTDPNEEMAGAAPADASVLEFSLVDFGSSTDCKAWLAGRQGSWQAENPTGDARYWGPASWVRFLGGADTLSQDPELTRQYSRGLDMFALAACALETLMKLHLAEYPSDAALRTGPLQAALAHSVKTVRMSWSAYWSTAVRSFDLLAEYSRLVCCGDRQGAGECWKELVAGSIPRILQDRLHELCAGLVALARLCRRQEEEGGDRGGRGQGPAAAWAEVGLLLESLRDMVHESSALEWPELAARLGGQPLAGGAVDPAARAPPAADVASAQAGAEEEERELQAAKTLHILSQVELEVATLKRWYAEALEAMRPQPSAACCGSSAQAAQRPLAGHFRLTPAC